MGSATKTVVGLDGLNQVHWSLGTQSPVERRKPWPITGRADISTRAKIDFKRPDAANELRYIMSIADTQGWEGLVLKRSNEHDISFRDSAWQVKLEKDYIPGLADSADLAVIGSRRDPKVVQALSLGNLSWTTFYLACLENRDEVQCFDARPSFRIVGTVTRPCVSIADLNSKPNV